MLKYLSKREELLNKRNAVKAEKEAQLVDINSKITCQSDLVKQLKTDYFLTLEKDKEEKYKEASELLNKFEIDKKNIESDLTILNKNYYIDYNPEELKQEVRDYINSYELDAKVKKFENAFNKAIKIAEEIGKDTKVISDDITLLLRCMKDLHLDTYNKRALHDNISNMVNGEIDTKLVFNSNVGKYIPVIYYVMLKVGEIYPNTTFYGRGY